MDSFLPNSKKKFATAIQMTLNFKSSIKKKSSTTTPLRKNKKHPKPLLMTNKSNKKSKMPSNKNSSKDSSKTKKPTTNLHVDPEILQNNSRTNLTIYQTHKPTKNHVSNANT
jgi:hypothetical protein